MHPAIEVSTGPLGQGISNAVGMAIGEAHMAATFNPVAKEAGLDQPLVDSYTFVVCGDGCLQEGISSEAASLAGHLGLGRLIVMWDDNGITIDGETHLSFTEDTLKRYEAYGWQTLKVTKGDSSDTAELEAAIEEAKKETKRPTIIRVTTTIGFGSKKQGTEAVHGAALGKEDLAFAKTALGFDPAQTFVVPSEVSAFYQEHAKEKGRRLEEEWNARLERFCEVKPKEGAEFKRRLMSSPDNTPVLPAGWLEKLPRFTPADKADATRNLSGAVLGVIGGLLPELMGGSADLTPSNKTHWSKGLKDFQKETPEGRYLRFGVREHAMAAVCNGLAAWGGFLPYCGTFLNFLGYALGAIRLSALSHFRVIYVATHDSIGLGEDGPTHQPVEMLEALRATPNTYVYRPADGNETSAAYACALMDAHHPAVLALSRQNLPHLAGSSIEKAMQGGYTVWDSNSAAGAEGKPDLVVAATGSEVTLAIEGAKQLVAEAEAEGKKAPRVQIASFPCLELFEAKDEAYRRSVLPDGVPVLSIEASATKGWERYSHCSIGLTTFGLSGPYEQVYKKLGVTSEAVHEKGKKMIAYYASNPVPALAVNRPRF